MVFPPCGAPFSMGGLKRAGIYNRLVRAASPSAQDPPAVNPLGEEVAAQVAFKEGAIRRGFGRADIA